MLDELSRFSDERWLYHRKYEKVNLDPEIVGVVTFSFFVTMVALVAICVVTALYRGFWELGGRDIAASVIDMCGQVVCVTMMFATLSDTLQHRLGKTGYYFVWMVFIVSLTLAIDCLTYLIDAIPQLALLNFILTTAVFLVCEMPLVLMWLYFTSQADLPAPRKRYGDVCVYSAQIIWWVLLIANIFTGIIFTVNDAGEFMRGPWYGLFVIPVVLGLGTLVVSAVRSQLPGALKVIFVTFAVLGILSSALLLLTDLPPLVYAVPLVTLLLFYGDMYIQRGAALAHSQEELADQRFAVMVSQIQPHFLYNSLTAIMGIPGNPPETRDAIAQFGKYLRANLDSLTVQDAIPFVREMDHARNYIALEQLRFGSRLKVSYDLKEVDFFIPALTVQVLVENAIKHGLMSREEGGRLTVYSRKSDDGAYEVVVADDGVGFDASAPVPDDGRSHVGLANVGKRLQTMMGGLLEIWSEPGRGTVATIHIPCENADTPQGVNKDPVHSGGVDLSAERVASGPARARGERGSAATQVDGGSAEARTGSGPARARGDGGPARARGDGGKKEQK